MPKSKAFSLFTKVRKTKDGVPFGKPVPLRLGLPSFPTKKEAEEFYSAALSRSDLRPIDVC